MQTPLHRYWGADLKKPKNPLTLDGLHRLAEQRAKERSLEQGKRNQVKKSSVINAVNSKKRRLKLSEADEDEGILKNDKEEENALIDDESEGEGEEEGEDGGGGGAHNGKSKAGLDNQNEDVSMSEEEEEEGEGEEPGGEDSVGEMNKTGDDEKGDTPTLLPLGRANSKSTEAKQAVHRQLPDWIINAEVVENNIQEFSR